MKEKASGLAAVGSAILASSCCILPLIAASVGFGIGGVATFFDELRPYLLVVTFLALSFSFYLVYIKKRKTECADGTCETKGSSVTSKVVLWIVTGLVLIITFFPNYFQYIF